MVNPPPLLSVNNLRVNFATPQGVVSPVREVSFTLHQQETLGIIGESGCGKSVTAQALMGLLSPRTSRTDGEVTLNGARLDTLSTRAKRQRCGRDMAMIFQDPLSSLNPVFTIGFQIDESLKLHTSLDRSARREKILSLLTQVGIADPARCANAYPHELSGGMRQRVMIAIAIASAPSLLIADEPTTALDATIQAQILRLLEEIKRQSAMGIVIITHDLSVVAQLCQRVVVLYAGQVVEECDVSTLFHRPRHPYTQALLAARPSQDRAPKTRLAEIRGSVPPLNALPVGCTFADRCPLATETCRSQPPALRAIDSRTHQVRCWRAEETGVNV
ncbi:ABC transporter ATP-binding protein [Pseudescherichia vulneris]|uniref:ABC transporter ATP-binding protein n=1 Tax=Pseudescherichia vulneris TaxID=566 RepID=UPI0028AF2E00|nr:ABC transporter ATP-binding protein [Pseudescherichia vulneris]